jgi:4-phytase/acid phosphatase
MRAAFRFALLVAGALPVLAFAAPAEHVRLEIVLMRHGVRSPTSAPEKLGVYSSDAWPAWPVAPGILTPHGEEGMRALGESYRKRLVAEGTLAQACPSPAEVDVIGDSTPRNRVSAKALVAGLAPGCDLAFRGLPAGTNNPLFHYGKGNNDDGDDVAPPSLASPALAELQQVLLGCNDVACLAAARDNGKKPLDMKSAGSLSENLMLSYVQGMPLADVGWGRADVAAIGRLITLHNAEFAASKKSQPAASRAGSNLMLHILATLQSAAGRTSGIDALTPTSTRVLVLVGHDTNLANIAGVLGVDWHDASRPDDYPPGGALVFDLVEKAGGYVVRTRTVMPSLDDLRHNRFNALAVKPVSMSGCVKPTECTLVEFSKRIGPNLDKSRIDDSVPAMTSFSTL